MRRSSVRRGRRPFRPVLECVEERVVPSFVAPLAFDAGPNPNSVTVGEFNGDGLFDLVVPNAGSANVSMLLGNGDGTFQAARSFISGGNPAFVAVADVNSDGYQDLAVAIFDGVSVLLGNGDGSFQVARTFSTGIFPSSVAVADTNNDGFQDLAVANSGSDHVSVLLGHGDGTFQEAQHFNTGRQPRSVAVGDVNGDGLLDLAVANGGLFPDPGNVSVLLGNGDGAFQTARNFSAGNGPLSVLVADVNGDGTQDLAVANGFSNNVSVLVGIGDGTFETARNFSAGNGPRSVVVGDVNGDGVFDLAVANYGTANVSVLLGNGDGTFQTARPFGAGGNPNSVVMADLNGDGVFDLAVANRTNNLGSVSVLLGYGDGAFQAVPKFSAGNRPNSVAMGDVNGDGVFDLVVGNADYGGADVSVLLGIGDGAFQPARSFSAGARPNSIAVGDFNGDGFQDLAVTHSAAFNTASVLLSNGDGSFRQAISYSTGNRPNAVAVADFNGDGILDLAVACGSGTLTVLLGNGDGSFQAARNISVGGDSRSVAVGDFNSDGLLDLAIANYLDRVSVLLSNGDGTFQNARNFNAGNGPVAVAVGDFNGDGMFDLAVVNGSFLSTTVSVLLGNGAGEFQVARTFPVGFLPNSVAVGDFNSDGLLDLAVVFRNGVRVLLGNGDGTFQITPVSYVAGSFPSAVAAGDVNGDGVSDLAVANFISNDVSILLNDNIWAGPGGAPGGGSFPSAGFGPQTLRFLAGEQAGVHRSVRGAEPLPPAERPRASVGSPVVYPDETRAMSPRRSTVALRAVDRLFAASGPLEGLYHPRL